MKVRVRVPATTSNLGPGLDVLGLALNLYNEVEMETLPFPGPVSVQILGEGLGRLSQDRTNEVVRAAFSAIPKGIKNALRFKLTNRIPIARGLGSSAAARLGGLLAVQALWAGELSEAKLLDRVCQWEGHPDNATAAFYGGLRACYKNGRRFDSVPLPFPKDIAAVVCVPEFELSTREARNALPKKVPLRDAISNLSRLALFFGSLSQGKMDCLKKGMEDFLHQPYRKSLARGMDGVIRAALKAGAHGAALSGAGPSILALAQRGPKASWAGKAMQKAFSRCGIESRVLVLDPDQRGAVVEKHP